jgi:hypothetical protein
MDFKDLIKQLGDRVIKLKDNIQTEEATKNAFIMPFIQALGYDVFNPLEVVPEYVTDIGTKKGEKIDYLILKDNQPTILIECKHWAQNLNLHDGQLLRYFHVSKAKFGILTNGIHYRFYTDLDQPNKMDEKPFLEFDIVEIKETQIEELKKFHKSYFEIENILNTASELKYINELKSAFSSEMKNPTEPFVKYFINKAYSGRATEKIVQQFTDLLKKSVNQVVNDLINERLKSALTKESEPIAIAKDESTVQSDVKVTDDKKLETTVEEMEAFFIVKSILRETVNASRIAHRDAQSYFSIMLDDNNRKIICRLYFNSSKKQIGLMTADKSEIKKEIQSLDEIYNFKKELIDALNIYEGTVNKD